MRRCSTRLVRRRQRSLPASRGWSRRMWFTRLLGCWRCSAFPGSMRRSERGWDGWEWWAFVTAFSGTYLIAVTGNFGFPRPGVGQAITGRAGHNQPVLAGGDRQWVGGNLVHDRLRAVWRRHDQDRDIASLGRRAGCCGCSGPSAGLGHFPPSPSFNGRMAGRHPGQHEPWASLGVVRLSDVARTGRFRRARVRKAGLTVSTGSSESPAANPPSTAHRVRVIIFAPRSGCAVCGAQSKPGRVSRWLRALYEILTEGFATADLLEALEFWIAADSRPRQAAAGEFQLRRA